MFIWLLCLFRTDCGTLEAIHAVFRKRLLWLEGISNKIIIICTYVGIQKQVNIGHYKRLYKKNPLNVRTPYFMLPQLLSQFFFCFYDHRVSEHKYFEWFSIRIYDWKPLMTCTGWTRKFISGKQRIGSVIFVSWWRWYQYLFYFFYFFLKGTTKILTEKFTRLQFNPSLNIYQLSYRTILLFQITRSALARIVIHIE